jgi:hypothetical protein
MTVDTHPTPFRGAVGHDTPTLAVLPAGLADRGISQALRRHSPTNHSLGRGTEQPGVPACGQGSSPLVLTRNHPAALRSY